MKIIHSNLLRHPTIIFNILKNLNVLDPFVILFNCETYFIRKNGKIISFLTTKNWFGTIELGTVYTLPVYRKKGYMDKLLKNVLFKFDDIGLLCNEDLEEFYKNYKFRKFTDTVKFRVKLFNLFLRPLFGYRLIFMKRIS